MTKLVSQAVMLKYLIVIIGVLSLVTAAIIFIVIRNHGADEPAAQVTSQKKVFAMGAVNGCAKIPPFISKLGLRQPIAIDTAQSLRPGLVIRETRFQQRSFQHQSWLQTGHVGSTVRDAQGNIYVIPVPSVGLDTNPMVKRNTVYKVEANTGIMRVLLELPLLPNDSLQNPFGTLGLALDCETNSLYVSSVANSTPTQENGVIYQIDLISEEIVSQWQGIDAIGLAVFNWRDEKRLYLGSARSSNVMSLPLSRQGKFVQPQQSPRYELSLLAIKNGNSTQARKLTFSRDRSGKHILTVVETEFAFRMVADTGRRFRHYPFAWNESQQRWYYIGR